MTTTASLTDDTYLSASANPPKWPSLCVCWQSTTQFFFMGGLFSQNCEGERPGWPIFVDQYREGGEIRISAQPQVVHEE